jgi:hypothetical protein
VVIFKGNPYFLTHTIIFEKGEEMRKEGKEKEGRNHV